MPSAFKFNSGKRARRPGNRDRLDEQEAGAVAGADETPEHIAELSISTEPVLLGFELHGCSLAELAKQLWSCDYTHLFLHELSNYPDVAVRCLYQSAALHERVLRVSSFTLCTCVRAQEPVIKLVSDIRSQRRANLVEDRASLLRLATMCSTLASER